MEALLVLLIVFLAVVLFVFPLWAFMRIRTQAEDLDVLRAQHRALEEEMRKRWAAAAVSSPVAVAPPVAPTPLVAVTPPPSALSSEQPLAASSKSEPVVGAAPSLPLGPSVTPPLPAATTAPDRPPAQTPLPSPPPLPPAVPPTGPVFRPPVRAKSPAINWEQFMGVKLFLWLGGLALFLGAVFFVKLSIEQGWLPPEVRVALGFLLGVGLVIGGVILSRKRYVIQAQTLCATGIVTLYAITFSCRSIYHFSFFGPGATLGLMVLITTTAFLLAVRLNAQVVALLGMLGGFLTPVLLSTGQDNPLGLFTYIALLDLGLLAVTLHRRWFFLAPLAALGTGIMQVGWAIKFLDAGNTLTAIIVCLVFDLLFLAGCAVARSRQSLSRFLSLSVAGLVALSFVFAFHLGLDTPAGLQPAQWLSFVFLADLCILGLVFLDVSTIRLHLGAGAAVFALLGSWTFSRLNADLLPWALGAYLAYAALHSAFPLVLRRLRPEVEVGAWHQLFTPLALLLILGPVLNSSYVSFAIWPVILLLDVLAIGLAWITGSLAAVLAVLVLTLFAAGQSIFRIPTTDSGGDLLWVVGGFALLFFVVGLIFARRFRLAPHLAQADAWLGTTRTQLPILSALLPFILLVMAASRLALPSPSSVFGLALLLVVLTLGLTRLLAIGALPGCALAGVLALSYTWQSVHPFPAEPVIPLLWYIGFYAIFVLFPFLFHRHLAETRGPWLASAAAGPLFFPLVFTLVKRTWPNDLMGLLPALFALPAVGCVVAILRLDPISHPRRLGRLALFGGVALLFITLIFPIQFDRQWITIAWALEGAAVLWLFHRVPHRGLPIAGLLLLGTAFVRLTLNSSVFNYYVRSGSPIFNWYLYTYGLVFLCLVAGARLLAPPRNRVLGLNAPAWLQAFAGILLFLLVNIEIADYFSDRGGRLDWDFSGNFARDMSYTIAWALYALGLLVVGIWKQARGARYAALGLLGVALLKLFFHDLARLGQLYRIGALMGVAVIAIGASFLYQRFLPPDEKKPDPAP